MRFPDGKRKRKGGMSMRNDKITRTNKIRMDIYEIMRDKKT